TPHRLPHLRSAIFPQQRPGQALEIRGRSRHAQSTGKPPFAIEPDRSLRDGGIPAIFDPGVFHDELAVAALPRFEPPRPGLRFGAANAAQYRRDVAIGRPLADYPRGLCEPEGKIEVSVIGIRAALEMNVEGRSVAADERLAAASRHAVELETLEHDGELIAPQCRAVDGSLRARPAAGNGIAGTGD